MSAEPGQAMSAAHPMRWEDAVKWLTEQPNMQDVVHECYYDADAHVAAARYLASEEFQTVLSYLPAQKGSILEIGAGRGISSYALAKSGWHVTALEPDPSDFVGTGSIRALAADDGLQINVVQEFGEHLPFADQEFDAVFTRQVLHHARDLKALCAEISRVLKPGGTFVALRDHLLHRPSDMQAFLDSHPLHHLYGGENAYLFEEYYTALRDAPLDVNQALRSFETPLHYGEADLERVRQAVRNRIARVPLLAMLARALTAKPLFNAVIRRLGRFDRRPGSAVSFICTKADR